MPVECRQLESTELPEWDALVLDSPQGTVYHTAAYKAAIDGRYQDGKLVFVGAFTAGKLVGGCVALERTRMRQRTAVTPLLTPYVGFFLRHHVDEKLSGQISNDAEVLTALTRWMCERYSYQLIVNAPELQDVRLLQAAGYTVSPRFTYEMDLQFPAAEQWLRLEGHVRRHIKKAEKAAFVISSAPPGADAFSIFAETFRKHGENCPVAESFFLEIVEGEALQPYRKHLTATKDGKLISFITALHFKEVAYYAVASTLPDHLQSGVSSLMIWRLAEMLRKDGIKKLDLVGANIPSIARFKEGFDPILRTFYQAEYYRGLHVKLGRKIARITRR
ncbi:MAG: GNAT family N-acetyltransferase [Candidatus Sumerlaeaceae bacterium]